jgi:hypothetical protein
MLVYILYITSELRELCYWLFAQFILNPFLSVVFNFLPLEHGIKITNISNLWVTL